MIQTHTLRITPDILTMIAKIDEFKGTWQLLGILRPDRLTALRRVATIESVGSSTRIEGSTLSDREVEALLAGVDIAPFSTRDEREVVGYGETMELVFGSWKNIPITESSIRQLHRSLLEHSEKDDWHRGSYKAASNSVDAFDDQGIHVGIILETASPFETPLRMEEMVSWFNKEIESRYLHPLLLIGIFTVVFLEIHPFQDGNGRLSRILTTLLLLRSGYEYVPYSSLESVIEQGKERYYQALNQTQRTIRSDAPDWNPWLSFFLHALEQQMARLQIKVERERILAPTLPELSQQILDHVRDHGRATIGELVKLTGANRNTLKKQLQTLVQDGHIVLHGSGRGAWYGLR